MLGGGFFNFSGGFSLGRVGFVGGQRFVFGRVDGCLDGFSVGFYGLFVGLFVSSSP